MRLGPDAVRPRWAFSWCRKNRRRTELFRFLVYLSDLRRSDLVSFHDCIICGLRTQDSKRGVTAPFLAARVWQREPFAVELRHCNSCDFLFFNPRLEPGEEALLYERYRERRYVDERHASEPWYTDAFNASLSSLATFSRRRKAVESALRCAGVVGEVGKVLDFGGNRGELIASLFPEAEKYVYDISQVDAIPGVQRVTLEDCGAIDFDLIICSNVLEHVALPRLLADQIESAANAGCRIFLEVPCESPLESAMRLRRAIQGIILFALRPRIFFSLFKFRTLNIMHEHLNFFTPRALATLASSKGWQFLCSGDYGKPSARMIWALVQA